MRLLRREMDSDAPQNAVRRGRARTGPQRRTGSVVTPNIHVWGNHTASWSRRCEAKNKAVTAHRTPQLAGLGFGGVEGGGEELHPLHGQVADGLGPFGGGVF